MKKYISLVWFIGAVAMLFAFHPSYNDYEIWEMSGHSPIEYSRIQETNDTLSIVLWINILISGMACLFSFNIIECHVKKELEDGDQEQE